MIDNQPCREAFAKDFANYKKDWSDDDCPLLPEEVDAYKAGYETAWNTRTPPISYDAAVQKVSNYIRQALMGYDLLVNAAQGDESLIANKDEYLAKAALAAMGISEGK